MRPIGKISLLEFLLKGRHSPSLLVASGQLSLKRGAWPKMATVAGLVLSMGWEGYGRYVRTVCGMNFGYHTLPIFLFSCQCRLLKPDLSCHILIKNLLGIPVPTVSPHSLPDVFRPNSSPRAPIYPHSQHPTTSLLHPSKVTPPPASAFVHAILQGPQCPFLILCLMTHSSPCKSLLTCHPLSESLCIVWTFYQPLWSRCISMCLTAPWTQLPKSRAAPLQPPVLF